MLIKRSKKSIERSKKSIHMEKVDLYGKILFYGKVDLYQISQSNLTIVDLFQSISNFLIESGKRYNRFCHDYLDLNDKNIKKVN